MSQRQSVHDLRDLVRSFHSLIAVETGEEDRVLALVTEVAAELQLSLFEWSVTTGFRRGHGLAVEGTTEALDALKHIAEMRGDAVYLMKDLAPHLSHAATARLLRELVQKMARSSSSIILTGDPIDLPRDIEGLAVRFRLPLPDEHERRGAVRAVVESMKARQPVFVDLSRDDAQQLVRALAGLTLDQTRRIVAQAIIEDGKLSTLDVDRVLKSKAELIARGGVLELYPSGDDQSELGGFGSLKRWLEHARIGFTPEAKALNLHPPKGVLFVGVQGCGKSLAAKFIARQWRLPLLKLDAGRLYEKYVGESEKNFRRATAVAEAMAPFVDLPSRDERANILAIHLGRRKQDPAAFDVAELANATEGFSGAELEQAVIAALYRSLHARQPMTTQSLLETVRSTVPLSVSRREDVQRLRDFSKGRFTPVA